MALKFITICGIFTLVSAASMVQLERDSMRLQRQQQNYADQQQQLIDMQQDFQDQMSQNLEQQNDIEQNNMHQAQMRMEIEEHRNNQQIQNINQRRREQMQDRFMSPISHQSQSRSQENNDSTNYGYAYSVNDRLTGDVKTHTEHRRGDRVQGQYSLIDADGFRRIVDYTANDRDGFQSEVRRLPLNYRWNTNDQLVYAISNNNLNRFGSPTVSNVLIPAAYSTVTRRDGPGSFNTLIKY